MIVTAQTKSHSTQQVHARASLSGDTVRFLFPKASRLLKHSAFQNVYEGGRRHFSTSMTFFYVLSENASSKVDSRAHIGFTVGRVLGGAVDRNRIKRRMRDLVRHQLGTLNNTLLERCLFAEIVINPKKSALTAEHEALRAEVERGFNVIGSAKLQTPGYIAPKPKRRESKGK